MFLYNRLGKSQLLARLNSETFHRKTLSFYRYVEIENPEEFRDLLFFQLDRLGCLGRIYVASEGINAQMNIPEPCIDDLNAFMKSIPELQKMDIKWALEENQVSFLKLKIKVREKIVADGLDEKVFDACNVGKHLSPLEFHELSSRDDVIVVDMRNNYESEVGHFENAFCPDAETFRKEVEIVVDKLASQKDKTILLYCTGGVRCEKASAWMRHHGFTDVNQLHGGIIAYVQEIRNLGISSRFIGKNFVFDERLGERVTPDIIANCHTCDAPCDNHYNCAWDTCHKLFIQCDECRVRMEGCCTDHCKTSFLFSTNNSNHHQSLLENEQIVSKQTYQFLA